MIRTQILDNVSFLYPHKSLSQGNLPEKTTIFLYQPGPTGKEKELTTKTTYPREKKKTKPCKT